jgi:hypothetical protein
LSAAADAAATDADIFAGLAERHYCRRYCRHFRHAIEAIDFFGLCRIATADVSIFCRHYATLADSDRLCLSFQPADTPIAAFELSYAEAEIRYIAIITTIAAFERFQPLLLILPTLRSAPL